MTNTTSTQIRPFTIDIPQDALDDLQHRLAHTRYPAPALGDAWTYGTPVSYLRDMVERWQRFDWRAQEARMNAVPNFATDIDGQTIHFVHVRSTEADATPLLLLHTYPGSFAEFLDLIGPLTDPVAHGGQAENAFHVVVPSMPGFGFSTPMAPAPGGGDWTMAAVARAYDTLMRRLGYDSYGTHGSDGGAMISRELAVLNPEGFLGAHVLQLFSFPSGDPAEFEKMTPKDYAALEFAGWFQDHAGFSAMMASRPQTVAHALADSPAGQLAWNELFVSFGEGSLLTRDQILTQVTLYWLTNTSGTTARFYYEEGHAGVEPAVNTAPTGVAVFADDFKSMRPFAERDNTNIVHWTEHASGGHFASMEVPEVVAADVRTFFAGLRAKAAAHA